MGTQRLWRNWSRNSSCRPTRRVGPGSEEELCAIVAAASATGSRVRVVGSGHSFSALACTDDLMISLDNYQEVIDIDKDQCTITVQGGMRLSRLNKILADNGLALRNLGDVDAQSIAGAIATGTHGTGVNIGNISSFVERMTLVRADGSILESSAQADEEIFRAARISLGALGVISTVTLRVEPAYALEMRVEPASVATLCDNLDEYVETDDHFEFFWWPHSDSVHLMRRNRRSMLALAKRSSFTEFFHETFVANWLFGLTCRVGRAFPSTIPWINRNLVGTAAKPHGWVDTSHRVLTHPRTVRFSEMEYSIPRHCAKDAIQQVRAMVVDRGYRLSFPIEVRFVAADDALLSPTFDRESCYIAVHVYQGMEHEHYFRDVETIMKNFGGRPHWGKLHSLDRHALRAVYPRFDDFLRIRAQMDPKGLFHNDHLDRVLGPPAAG